MSQDFYCGRRSFEQHSPTQTSSRLKATIHPTSVFTKSSGCHWHFTPRAVRADSWGATRAPFKRVEHRFKAEVVPADALLVTRAGLFWRRQIRDQFPQSLVIYFEFEPLAQKFQVEEAKCR
jgi:hypothetical protein